MLAKNIRGNGVHQPNFTVSRVSDWAALTLTAAFAILFCSALRAEGQPLGQKQSTASGNLVTVYSISWPTPLSSVTADVEVCAGPSAPANSFAFPSFSRFISLMEGRSARMVRKSSLLLTEPR